MACNKPRIPSPCGGEVLTNSTTTSCEAFTACLGFGRSLTYDGTCIRLEGSSTIADGEYSSFTVANGCITGASQAPVPEYTPTPCAPSADPCGGSGGGSVSIQTNQCNMLSVDASGALGAYIVIEEGEGVNVEGCGTTTNPLKISVDGAGGSGGSSTYVTAAVPSVIDVTGTGTVSNPYEVTPVESGVAPGTYGGFTVDRYGRITAYAEESLPYVISVLAGDGIDVTTQGGIATVSLKQVSADPGTYQWGGYDVTTDLAGRVIDVQRTIALTAGVYDPLFNNYLINDYGSIADIVTVTRTADFSFSKLFTGNRSNNSMTITTTYRGFLRITYTGDLGSSTSTANGLINLPSAYSVTVNNLNQSAYARVINSRLAEVYVVGLSLLDAGTHSIVITGPDDPDTGVAFSDIGIMDVQLIALGG